MIISKIGRYVIWLQLTASASSVATDPVHAPSFRGGTVTETTQRRNEAARGLQGDFCTSRNKKGDCDGGGALCAWEKGSCVPAPTPGPTAQPTPNPTPGPTPPPTPGPTAQPTPNPTPGPTPLPTPGPTDAPTEAPTNKPTTSPTTKSPTAGPTSNPTENPTTGAPTKAPTDDPTVSPTRKPTPAPTNKPITKSPTVSPTPQPTPQPTNYPTKSPTDAPTPQPTNGPTNSPTLKPTGTPTKQPTNLPTGFPTTANPTSNPTAPPTPSPITDAPTSSVEAVTCPPVTNPVSMVTITPGLKAITAAPSGTFCGIFIRKATSGDLIPIARTYDGHGWEAAAGPLAVPAKDVTATHVTLHDLQNANDEYVIMSKDGSAASVKPQIAKFLEMTTFGPKKSEIDALYGADGSTWGEAARASYVRQQMDLPATSHREYWRKRTNSKWDATAQPARSDHPCSPGSKWRRYSYTRQDRYHTIDNTFIYTRFETVPEEAGLTYTIHEADKVGDVSSYKDGTFTASNGGFSGSGYFDFGGTNAFLEFSIDVAQAGTKPISFRFANGNSSYNGNRKCQLWVNNVLVVPAYNFKYTASWSYWKYSDLVNVDLVQGTNLIKLVVNDQSGGPNVDHLRVGKPPAVVMKTNGWPRVIAKNGLHLLDKWPYEFTNETAVYFESYPDAPQGDLYRYHYGRLRVRLPDDATARYLEIGNPPVDFTGYEQYLPPNVFNFAPTDTFVNAASDLYPYPIHRGQELILVNGFTGPVCERVPPFAEEYDAPIIGRLPDGSWLQWTPTILFEDNGPSINDSDMTAKVLSDGGGASVIQTGEKLKCSNVQRSFINEDTCFLSKESTACSASQPVGEVLISMNKTNILEFYNLADKYVYAIRGLVMEDLAEHACMKTSSRWEVAYDAVCNAPTALGGVTRVALEDAINKTTDKNGFTKDVTRTLACDALDKVVSKINIQIQVGSNCYTHAHPNHLNVYDFSGWVTNHPGGEYNIQKWAQGWGEGWYLDFPFNGDAARKIPKHAMSRWYNNAAPPDIVYVTRLGNEIAFRDLPNDLKTDAIAQRFGAVPQSLLDGGVVVCGSIGEVANDPTLPETFDVRSNEHTTLSSDDYNNQKQVVWTEIALYGQDQLRQRMAWALAQIVTTVPGNIDAYDRTEIYTNYYDIFVSYAFDNYRQILARASYSPLMAEHLSYLRSKSHSYVYASEGKRISRADENFAREIMQLFSIGLILLNDDGTPVMDPATGTPLETYTNADIESLARAWTGFDRTGVRGNYEESNIFSTGNRLDPMIIEPSWRDPFPKADLNGGFIGDGYLRCSDLPVQSFLKAGARYRLLGGKPSPNLMKDPSFFADSALNNILRVELTQNSLLYQRLHNGGNFELSVELESDLDCTVGTVECDVDTLRVVKVGSVYYEFVERPCVQMAFYDNGKQIQLRDNYRHGQMCANPDLTHAREACCREDRVGEVRYAKTESGLTYKFDGERMTWATAQDRCVAYGMDLCVYETVSFIPEDNYWRKGYHWTNKDCGINVKVNSEGHIAIVHDAMSTYIDNIPWLVEEANTLNWFRVFWDGGSYPGDSETNTCTDNGCKTMADGSCLCKTTVTESVVFTDTAVSKEEVMSQLFVGALGPQADSTATDLLNGVIVHKVGDNVDGNTVFQVQDKGRIMYLKNILSTVSLEGWTMPPQVYEAEDATVNNANVTNFDTVSATGGLYVLARYGNETTYVEWEVSVPSSGTYSISLRHATDESPRPLSVFVNTQEVFRQLANPNTPVSFNNIHSNPDPTLYFPLQRCAGDCDSDNDCAKGLFCMQIDGYERVPGCTGTRTTYDYCVSINDFDYGFTLLPTGGWDNDWHYSESLPVNLNAGTNTIRVQLPAKYKLGPNIDHLKIEGLPKTAPSSSFRNPPHFMSLIPDYSPGGLGEQNLRDAQYETDAVLDHYFYQSNMAPFLCTRIMQRFSFSNPSPRFVASCVQAFRTGSYTYGVETFGSGKYGSLEAMAASIFLDEEATNLAISHDPSYGSIREPMLKVTHLMRSMLYQTSLPTTLDGALMQETYNVKLWKIDETIGHGPYEFPSVFSYFLPEYVPESGPNLSAKLASPESMLVTMPNVVALLNGMFSLIKYGLGDCNNGFSRYPGYSSCTDNGKYERSFGHLSYQPTGVNDNERAADLALLLTAGRLSESNLNTVVGACSSEPDQPSKTRCMQQLIVTTGEFHSTNTVTQSGEARVTDTSGGVSPEPYKTIVYFYLSGGLDSYNMLAPHTCTSAPVYDRYRTIRGKSGTSEGVGLPLSRLLAIPANNPNQPCESFGIHENLPKLKALYDQGKLKFIANAGLLAKPVTVADYSGETPVQLFAHNAMTLEAAREDIMDKFTGTGVGGRIADVLTQAGIPTDTFSINGQQVLLTGEPGQGPSQFILSSSGLASFNADPSITNMDDVIMALNNDTTADSGFHSETWSQKLSESLVNQKLLKQAVDATTVTTVFPISSIADQFELITRIMQTREARGAKRDIFYVQDGGYDTHSNVDESLINNFSRINGAIEAFVNELVVLGLWESTVVIQFSEFARTLDPNTGDGTDHAWGGNHFMFGGALNGGQVLGQYPSDFEQHSGNDIALSRGRMIPTTPWDAMWKGVAEWFGIPATGPEMDKVLPMHQNFPGLLYTKADLFDPPAASAELTWDPMGNVGAPFRSGEYSDDGTIQYVKGSGFGISGKSDQFFFYNEQIPAGDVLLVMHINRFDNWALNSRGGLMIRDSKDPSSANVFVGAAGNDQGVVFQSRAAAGLDTVQHKMIYVNNVNQFYVKLEKAGDVVTAYYKEGSADAWIELGSMTLPITGPSMLVGRAVTAGSDYHDALETMETIGYAMSGGTSSTM